MKKTVIELQNIGKSFPGVRALDGIDLSFLEGEIHAVVGENGAGKSTLMKILAGEYRKDEGTILLDGEETTLGTPRRAQERGIGMIHQELTLLPDRTIAQNILLGREPRKAAGLVDGPAMAALARENLVKLDLDLDPGTLVSSLPIALRQMVEISKALSLNARVLILDEPTSSLTESETQVLMRVMATLRDQGMTLIYISHRLEEVFASADRITVLRDGRLIETKETGDTDPADVVRMMVGRELGDMFPKTATPKEEVVLEVDGLSGGGFRDVSLRLRAGEVLGISGLVGAGRTEFARALFGLDPISGGTVMMAGDKTAPGIRRSLAKGLAYVPEDRKDEGLFLDLSVRKNLTVNILARHSRFGLLDFRRLGKVAGELIDRLKVRPPDPAKRIRNLSGGNQQKVVIAKWLSRDPRILILDEPTRGIDVGAKAEIYALIDGLADKGVGIIVISSELPEVLGISDRILVMREGLMVGEFGRGEADQDDIMHLAAGAAS